MSLASLVREMNTGTSGQRPLHRYTRTVAIIRPGVGTIVQRRCGGLEYGTLLSGSVCVKDYETRIQGFGWLVGKFKTFIRINFVWIFGFKLNFILQ